MGMSANAKLVYGYDLNGYDGDWAIEEAGEYGELNLPWYDAEDGDDFQEAAKKRLLASVGFTETYWRADGYFDRRREAEKRLGVEFLAYSYELGGTILGTHEVDSYGYGSKTVDLAELAAHPDIPEWDRKLAAAITALGITPKQDRPRWILAASYG